MEPEALIQAYIDSHSYELSDYQPDFTKNMRAAIVETRPLPNLLWTIKNIAFHTRWPVLVFCSEDNTSMLDELDFPVEKILIEHIAWNDYTWALVSDPFWARLPESILIFQTDSFMLRSGLDAYTRYDYVGAPWSWAYANENLKRFRFGGNGGFSFRKASVMRKIIEAWPYETVCQDSVFDVFDGLRPPEDMYFAYGLSEMSACVPDLNDKMRFAVETIPYPQPLAVHAIERQLTTDQIRTILSFADKNGKRTSNS